MRKNAASSLALIVAMVFLGGCAQLLGVEGSGNVVTESREVSDFTQIVLTGSGRVMVEITGTESVSIEAEDNILPELETVVRNGRLELGARVNINPTEEIVYTVTAAAVDGVEISGSGRIVVTGVDSTDFEAEISGSGAISVEGVVADHLRLDISGSGDFDGADLTASTGEVEVSGSGTAVVNVGEDLVVSLSGSGEIEYIGSPSIEVDKSGSGTVTQRD